MVVVVVVVVVAVVKYWAISKAPASRTFHILINICL